MQDEKALIQSAVRQYPMLKGAAGYEYGYKIMVSTTALLGNTHGERLSVNSRGGRFKAG